MVLPAPILIAAINARHSHASMGARCLLANMGELRDQTELAEFTIQQSAAEIAAARIARAPKILALGVYIWNAARVAELLPLLRHQSPQTKIILGGPEIPSVEPPTASSGGGGTSKPRPNAAGACFSGRGGAVRRLYQQRGLRGRQRL